MRRLLMSVCLSAVVFTVAACGGSSAPEDTPAPAELAAAAPGQPPAATSVAEALAPAAAVAETITTAITAAPDTGTPTATPGLALAAPSELLDSYRIAATYIITSQMPDGQRRVDSTQLQGAWRRTDGTQGYDAAFALANVSGSRRQELNFVAVGDAAAIQ